MLIEEAAAAGWAVVVLDVEGEYTGMDAAGDAPAELLAKYGLRPGGLSNLRVIHPASSASERPDSKPFTLRLADFETAVVTELIQATRGERNALIECIENFQSKAYQRVLTTEVDRLKDLLDPSPKATRIFTLQQLHERAENGRAKAMSCSITSACRRRRNGSSIPAHSTRRICRRWILLGSFRRAG